MAKTFSRRQNEIVSNMNLVLHNVFVLYFILILSLANMFYLVTAKNYMFAAIFILTGFITSFFSKNMMVVLCISLTVTNVLQFGKSAALEGFEEEEEEEEEEKKIAEGFENEEEEEENPKLAEGFEDDAPVNSEEPELNMEGMEDEYKRLSKLQETITKNMQNITEPLSEAEGIVNGMAKKLGLRGMN